MMRNEWAGLRASNGSLPGVGESASSLRRDQCESSRSRSSSVSRIVSKPDVSRAEILVEHWSA